MKLNGLGKYDEIATLSRTAAEADAVVLIVVNGLMGSGFSVQANNEAFIEKIPDILEAMAKQKRFLKNCPSTWLKWCCLRLIPESETKNSVI